MISISAIYIMIGIAYCVINGGIRKLDNDDWTLAFVWLFLWPLCLIALIIDKFNTRRRKC